MPTADELTLPQIIASTVELAMYLGGLILLWRYGLRAQARAQRARLGRWNLDFNHFLICVVIVLCGGFLLAMPAAYLLRLVLPTWSQDAGLELLLSGGGLQFGLLGGALAAAAFVRRSAQIHADPVPLAAERPGNPLLTGLATFLIALPLVTAVAWLWTFALDFLGLPAEQQDLVMLLRETQTPGPVIMVFLLAVMVAPVAEELIFRAGMFRYLRTRVSRSLALIFPAIIFGCLHGNWFSLVPLTLFAIILALSYERNGSVWTTIVAHSLFNLNTLVLILIGTPFDSP